MVDASNRPQIFQHICKSLTTTVYDTLWVPSSARFVVLGSTARSTGSIQVYELSGSELNEVAKVEKSCSFKCGTFGASSLVERQLATGDFKGNLHIWDLEKMGIPVFHVKGRVCVWDQRQKDDPVALFEPETRDTNRDCWSVAFGNSYNDEERCVMAGYDNGDIKLFDLRTGKVPWETTLKSGVCGIQFDRKDIAMNKCVATTLESQFHVFDLQTQHPELGILSITEKMAIGTTIWGVKHLPQNREVFMVLGGDGSLSLYKHSNPSKRSLKSMEGRPYGITDKVNLLSSQPLSTQPVACFDWSPDKEGLAVFGSFDQCIRVAIVTKLNKI
ncbi:dynein axonemal assembly factor 10 isoform X2 [Cryptomeria japonica]|uniref:dynein axonemal assembly factor 10 isoform X2 n=1 Tax=Cryptomeria japonica TaxID=3369 RepID=UPI0027DAB31E|nr:dynein axonemal assembly factor 10 isoform X2 [Cryptomeria japonica]